MRRDTAFLMVNAAVGRAGVFAVAVLVVCAVVRVKGWGGVRCVFVTQMADSLT